MIIDLYSVYDRVSNEYNVPFPAKNKDLAVRMFNNALENNPFRKDMCLYYVGQFNTETGDLRCIAVDFICNYEEEVKKVEA